MSPPFQPLRLLLVMFAGWVKRNQLEVIAYLQEENRVLTELIVVPDEAAQVRRIFALYRNSGSVQKLQEKLFESNEVSKVRITRSGKPRGGQPFSRGALYL